VLGADAGDAQDPEHLPAPREQGRL
jgi:hypothetical protein